MDQDSFRNQQAEIRRRRGDEKLALRNLRRQIHQRALAIAKDFKTKEIELIKILQEVEDNGVYKLGGYGLFTYAVKALGLTEAQSYNYISVAKKARQLPALQKALETHEVAVSKARKICSVITEQNQAHWVELAKTLSTRELEREV